MLETVANLMRAASLKNRKCYEEAHAVELLEVKIHDISAHHDNAKRTLATMLARIAGLTRAANSLKEKTRVLEKRAKAALKDGKDDLAMQAAQVIADRENELVTKRATIEKLEVEAASLRSIIERTERRLIELRQGLTVARHTVRARKARVGTLNSVNRADASHRDAEIMLERILAQSDEEESLAQFDKLNEELSGADISERLEAEGYGPRTKVQADDVLARLKAKRQNK